MAFLKSPLVGAVKLSAAVVFSFIGALIEYAGSGLRNENGYLD
jgi:hypothetical protein